MSRVVICGRAVVSVLMENQSLGRPPSIPAEKRRPARVRSFPPAAFGANSGRPTRRNSSTRRSNSAPTSSGCSPNSEGAPTPGRSHPDRAPRRKGAAPDRRYICRPLHGPAREPDHRQRRRAGGHTRTHLGMIGTPTERTIEIPPLEGTSPPPPPTERTRQYLSTFPNR